MLSRLIVRPLAVAVAFALAGQSSAALAHAGDHSLMTFAGIADHLLSNLDHTSAIMAIVTVAAAAGASALLAYRKR
jgi:hypothetical protein